jgi:phosphoadenosine phosphosulfate reductase
MYSYTHDPETGGLLLNTSPCQMSREPRPVYAAELDLLGFGKYWNYERQNDTPYLWAEANRYWYRGQLVAETRGGDLYHAPELVNMTAPEPDDGTLRPVDISTMVARNREILTVLEQMTVRKIFEVYRRFRKKLDVFHVAYSGGKDSAALLDLVKKALPHNEFVVVFGDTGMEFPDTYEAVEQERKRCESDGVAFYITHAHLSPQESWKLFGPPSRVLRWCCSVHKSSPQTLLLRKILNKSDFAGLAFVGIRAEESMKRSGYKYLECGKKVKGQYSHNSILEWTSAEIWLYLYAQSLPINNAYRKGSARVGCLCCPMGGGKAFVERSNYPEEVGRFTKLIMDSNARTESNSESYLTNGGWNARKNGRFLAGNFNRYSETTKNGLVVIDVAQSQTDWREWMKTLGNLNETSDMFHLIAENKRVPFAIKNNKSGYTVSFSNNICKESPLLGKLFRQVFRKAAYCIQCGACQADCRRGCISFKHGFSITSCMQCHECHEVNAGCLVYDSLKIPAGDGEHMNRGINAFSNHAPKPEWFVDFFEHGEGYLTNNSLGPVQKTKFKRFLSDAELIERNSVTSLFAKIKALGWNGDIALGIMLANLAYNPQISWYIKNLDVGRIYPRNEIESMLGAFEQSKDNMSSIINAWGRICKTPFGIVLRFGQVLDDDAFLRTPCVVTDTRVILYSLYKFAEACGDYRQFTLTRLLSHTVESDGISPTQIFGLTREQIEPILNGLAARYPDFIQATFTHDLEKITLPEGKTSKDILGLF